MKLAEDRCVWVSFALMVATVRQMEPLSTSKNIIKVKKREAKPKITHRMWNRHLWKIIKHYISTHKKAANQEFFD